MSLKREERLLEIWPETPCEDGQRHSWVLLAGPWKMQKIRVPLLCASLCLLLLFQFCLLRRIQFSRLSWETTYDRKCRGTLLEVIYYSYNRCLPGPGMGYDPVWQKSLAASEVQTQPQYFPLCQTGSVSWLMLEDFSLLVEEDFLGKVRFIFRHVGASWSVWTPDTVRYRFITASNKKCFLNVWLPWGYYSFI